MYADVEFYTSQGARLSPDSRFTTKSKTPVLWYRVTTCVADKDGWQSWQVCGSGFFPIIPSLESILISAIDAHATVRDLKLVVADHMGIDDAQRIVISARNGMRKGLLEGLNWEVRRLQAWLCNSLSFDLLPKGAYRTYSTPREAAATG